MTGIVGKRAGYLTPVRRCGTAMRDCDPPRSAEKDHSLGCFDHAFFAPTLCIFAFAALLCPALSGLPGAAREERLHRHILAAEELRGVIEVGVDMDDLGIQLLQPTAPDGARQHAVGATDRLRIGRSEDDDLGFLDQIGNAAASLAQSAAWGVKTNDYGRIPNEA